MLTDNVFIADCFNPRIRKGSTNGIITTVAGNLFIVDSGNLRIRRVTPDGIINTVAVDESDDLLIPCGNRVRRLDTRGLLTTVAGPGRSDEFVKKWAWRRPHAECARQ